MYDTVALASAGSCTVSRGHTTRSGARVALAVLQRLRDGGLVERSAAAGAKLHALLSDALAGIDVVGDVRGRGLFAGIELVADRNTKAPFPRSARAAERVTRAARELGLLVYPSTGCADGTNGDIVLLGPPFIVTERTTRRRSSTASPPRSRRSSETLGAANTSCRHSLHHE